MTWERMHNVAVDTSTGCWEWTASRTRLGYGKFCSGGKTITAHRASYIHHKGAIPEGLVLDHLCLNRGCVNPDHLEPVTQAENLRRSPNTVNSRNASKPACLRGHEYTPENTRLYKGRRVCRLCVRARERTRNRRRDLIPVAPAAVAPDGTEPSSWVSSGATAPLSKTSGARKHPDAA